MFNRRTQPGAFASSACLDEEEVVAFSGGLASEEQMGQLERHLDACQRCFDLVAIMAKAPPPALANTLELSPGEPAVPPPAASSEAPLRRRLGRYELVGELGAGAMGVVYRAYDTVLRRFVALKLISSTGSAADPAAEERLLTEAHALARISHPNVVAVHDAGLVDSQLFIALELIDGVTLTVWQAGRSWREIVSAYIAAARGLAAVHALGLVHRDFKPDNVLIADERVVVSDFGLACLLDGPRELGRVCVGTPAYMAPEQFRGEPPDQRSDIFNFCAALYHSLHGQPAFDGDTLTARAEAVLSGRARPESRTSLPRWLKRVLRCGLARDPAARPPSMKAVIHLLEHEERVRRRRVWLGLAAAVAAVVILALSLWREHAPLFSCRGRAAATKAGWSASRRQALRAALLKGATPLGKDTWSRVEPLFARYHRALGESYGRACEATYRHRAESVATLDLRVACIESRELQASTLEALLSSGGEERIKGAVTAALGLPAVEGCDNVELLTAAVPPPKEPAARAAYQSAEDLLSSARASRLVADFATTETKLASAHVAAERSGHLPTRASVALEEAMLARDRGQLTIAKEGYERAYALGEQGRADGVRLAAASQLVNVVGSRLYNLNEGQRWARQADDLLTRVGRPEAEEAELTMSRGLMLLRASRLDEAEAQLRASLRLRQHHYGASHYAVSPAILNLAETLRQETRYPEAELLFRSGYELLSTAFGPTHPRTAAALADLAIFSFDRGKNEEAIRLYERALALLPTGSYAAQVRWNISFALSARGDHRGAAEAAERSRALYHEDGALVKVAQVEAWMGREWGLAGEAERGRALIASAVAVLRKQLPETDPSILAGEGWLAELDLREGHLHDGLARLGPLLAAARAAKSPAFIVTSLLDLEGRALRASGRAEEALPDHREALALRSAARPLELAHTLVQLGLAELAMGSRPAAAATFTRALALQKNCDVDPEDRAEASFGLAQALGGGANVARASSLARDALIVYRARGAAGAAAADKIHDWLAQLDHQLDHLNVEEK